MAICCLGFGLVSANAMAAPPPPRGPAAGAPSPVAEGTVARYLTTPYGDNNGLRLTDGTLVLFAPHIGARIGAAAAPGDKVRVIGHASPDGTLRATALVNLTSGASVDDGPPGTLAAPKPRQALQTLESSGTIDMILRGPRGEANGVLLTNGDIIYFRPDLLSTQLSTGQRFAAIGIGTRTATAISLEAITVGPDLDTARAANKATSAPIPRPAPRPPASGAAPDTRPSNQPSPE